MKQLNFGAAKRAVAMLSSLTPTSHQRRPASAELARTIADHAERLTGVSAHKVMGTRRQAEVALVRHVVMFVIREGYGSTFMDIGEAMNRDHGSVMHGHQRVLKMLEAERNDPRRPTAEFVRNLCALLEIPAPKAAAEKPGL